MRTTAIAGGPGFIADHSSVERNSGRQVAWELVGADRQTTQGQIVRLAAAAYEAEYSLSVAELAGAIEKGVTLHFASGDAKLTAPAAAGDTSIDVEPLATDLDDGDTARIAGSGGKRLVAGTAVDEDVVGSIRRIFPTYDGTGCIGLLATDANELSDVESLSGYGVITHAKVYEALLPDASGSPRELDADLKSALTDLGFSFEQYSDNTATV